MKYLLVFSAAALLGFPGGAQQAKVLTQDPLTALPLIPQTDSRLHLGNEPEKLPDMKVCKSNVQMNFYPLYDVKVSEVLSWYSSHLSGFKRVHGHGMNRSQDSFYNSEGTMIVGITGSPAPDGQDSDGYSVTYMHAQPGLSDKSIAALGQGKVVCQ